MCVWYVNIQSDRYKPRRHCICLAQGTRCGRRQGEAEARKTCALQSPACTLWLIHRRYVQFR